MKGLGGYHLACDAREDPGPSPRCAARKARGDKPFAVMARALSTAQHWPRSTRANRRNRVPGGRRPIVLLPRRAGTPAADPVAPGLPELGFMLPYAPVHHLLLSLESGIPGRTGRRS